MCLVSFPSDTSTPRSKALYKHRPQGPVSPKKLPRQPPPPPPPTPEPTPKGPKLSPRRGKQGNVPVPLGAANGARRGRSGSLARSSSRGDKRGGSNRTPKKKKERKRETDVEQWKEGEGGIAERMQKMHLQHLYNRDDQAKAQPQPPTRPTSWLPGSNDLYPSPASEAYYQGAAIQVQDFQHESQPNDIGNEFHMQDFFQPEEHVWAWLEGVDGRYILAAVKSSCSCRHRWRETVGSSAQRRAG